MAARRGTDESLINSIVGPGTFFRGHLELNGLLRIDGDFSGSVKTDGRVIVGQAGRADCAIQAGTVVIGGLFRGEILASEKVVLLSSSVVLGTITAPRLIAEDGVMLTGRFRITGSAADLVAQGDLDERRKELLLESVRTREASQAVTRRSSGGAGTGSPEISDDSGSAADEASGSAGASVPRAQEAAVQPVVRDQQGVAVTRGGSGEWNE